TRWVHRAALAAGLAGLLLTAWLLFFQAPQPHAGALTGTQPQAPGAVDRQPEAGAEASVPPEQAPERTQTIAATTRPRPEARPQRVASGYARFAGGQEQGERPPPYNPYRSQVRQASPLEPVRQEFDVAVEAPPIRDRQGRIILDR